MDPDVTVVVATYNARDYIERTVASVMDQSIGADRLDLVVVDDVSTDGTYEVLQALASRWHNMRVMRLETNSGAGSAPRNRGMEEARGRYVFILDADDYLNPEALERMVSMGDENSSDVVLGKMFGGGGRKVPRTMYLENQPDADLFDSRVYWTLNPMKLYRRELIERTGLRFPEDMLFHEDQVFVSQMYFAASKISVVADYDCVCWYHREDGGNLTFSVPFERRLLAHERMFGIVTDHLGPGAKRDRLMQRHFHIDVMDSVRRLTRGQRGDDHIRQGGFEQIREWTRAYYNQGIGMRLRPVHRIAYELIARGLFEDLPELFEFEKSGMEPSWVTDGADTFTPWPFFRDAKRGLPDYCYDVGSQVRARPFLDAVAWERGSLAVSGSAHLSPVETTTTSIELVARYRGTDAEVLIDTQFETDPTPRGRNDHPSNPDVVEAPGFTATIDVAALATKQPPGIWDVYARVTSGQLSREARVGAAKNSDIGTVPLCCFVGNRGSHVAAAYYTDPYGNLSLDVDQTKHKLPRLRMNPPGWHGSQTATMEVRGSVGALNVPRRAVSVQLSGSEDRRYDVVASLRETATETVFTALVPLKTVARNRPLPVGDWRATAQLETEGVCLSAPIPSEPAMPTIRWWRGLRPMHAKSVPQAGKAFRLRIKPVNLVHAARRRLGLTRSGGDDV